MVVLTFCFTNSTDNRLGETHKPNKRVFKSLIFLFSAVSFLLPHFKWGELMNGVFCTATAIYDHQRCFLTSQKRKEKAQLLHCLVPLSLYMFILFVLLCT